TLALVVRRFDQHPLGARHIVGWRHEQQRQVIACLEVLPIDAPAGVGDSTAALELGPALLVHEPGCVVWKFGNRIAWRPKTLSLEEDGPAGAEAPHDIV